MSIQNSCRYVYILTFSVLAIFGSSRVGAQAADTTATDSTGTQKVKKKELAGRQLCIGVDIVRPVFNNIVPDRYGYEFEADFYTRNEFYLASEGGWGGSKVTYSDLQYTTTNNFLRFGFNKSILPRDKPADWDMMLIGMRLGAADVNRSPATYTVLDSVWGNKTGSSPGKDFLAMWAELTGGMRVELLKSLFAGWNFRAKFILNGKSFNDLAPLYIAGYGKGDKNVAFDFNLYVSYGIRWKRNGAVDTTAITK